MGTILLSGSRKSELRGAGQRLEATIKIGREGLAQAGVAELRRQLASRELVKVRFVGSDRDERAVLCQRVAEETGSAMVGAVGHTALFYAPREAAGAAPGT
jgi:RNA-binding protein